MLNKERQCDDTLKHSDSSRSMMTRVVGDDNYMVVKVTRVCWMKIYISLPKAHGWAGLEGVPHEELFFFFWFSAKAVLNSRSLFLSIKFLSFLHHMHDSVLQIPYPFSYLILRPRRATYRAERFLIYWSSINDYVFFLKFLSLGERGIPCIAANSSLLISTVRSSSNNFDRTFTISICLKRADGFC